jgi:DNA-binding MarR family transcriptional regulator
VVSSEGAAADRAIIDNSVVVNDKQLVMSNTLLPVIDRVPRLFHLLKALGDALHQDLGVTTAMRGILGSLTALGPRTVPQLARERPVSRQYVQGVVNALTAAGLAELRANPTHQRSPLVALTAKGAATFEQVRRREFAVAAVAGDVVAEADVAAALRVLGRLEMILAGQLETVRGEPV